MSTPRPAKREKRAAPAASPESLQAADLLRRAAQWLTAVAPHGATIEWGPPHDRYGGGVIIRFDPPGVLHVFDSRDGTLRARSVVGDPGELDPAFVAPQSA